ncbi:hypothetical protein ACHAXR_013303 [Thalassiosira sp. AJA248-18]
MSDGESSGNDSGPDLPAGVLRSRGGWADEYNLEIEHQREKLREGADEHDAARRGEPKSSSHAAVDLSQFRNDEVGEGYQAKHVVRQKEASSSATAMGVVDMSGGQFSKKEGRAESSVARKRSHDADGGEKDKNGKKKQPVDDRLESYLKCNGMRSFMKEIDKILNQ